MVVARPLGTSIPVGPVSEQNPALSANWVSASLAEVFVFSGESGDAAASLRSAGPFGIAQGRQPTRPSLRGSSFFLVVH